MFTEGVSSANGERDRQVRNVISVVCFQMTFKNRELLDNLARVGFQTYLGPDEAGLLPLIFERGGGFYIGQ